MKVFYITESRIIKKEDKYYCDDSLNRIIERYRCIFPNLTVVGKHSSTIESQHVEISKEINVVQSGTTKDLFVGKNKKLLTEIVKSADLLILRIPSFIGVQISRIAKKNNKQYLVEVVGNAGVALWNHSLKGKLLAPYLEHGTKTCVRNANYALFVTSKYLQSCYPTNCLSIGISDVYIETLGDEFQSQREDKIKDRNLNCISILTAGAVHVRYKGQEEVIKAIPLLNKRGIKVTYYLAGKGDQCNLRRIARKHNVEDQVIFLGSLEKQDVFRYMDLVDFYIQPSYLEGLPRALIEAMSRGCVCIGTNVGGIPELLSPEMIVKAKSYTEIADKIIEISSAPKMIIQSKRNFDKAKEFDEDILTQKRMSFLNEVAHQIYKMNN